MTTSDPQFSKFAEAAGFTDMTEAQQAAFLQQAGEVVFESALARLVAGMDDAAIEELQEYLEGVSEDDNVLEYLMATYPAFSDHVVEEAEALQAEGESTLS